MCPRVKCDGEGLGTGDIKYSIQGDAQKTGAEDTNSFNEQLSGDQTNRTNYSVTKADWGKMIGCYRESL